MIAGEKVPDYRRNVMPLTAFIVLALGLLSTVASNVVFKSLAYGAGAIAFLVLLYFMNACVSEASNGGESLFHGSSFLRSLVVIIGITWIPFPIWYALSPEGFNVIKDEPGMKVAVAFLNVFSKGAFISYLARIRNDYLTRQKTMISIGYYSNDGNLKKGIDGLPEDLKARSDDQIMDKGTLLLIEEVLETMGRAKDRTFVVDLLQSHLITTNDDIISLTKDYCREIDLPWGLILALKSKIRSNHVQLDDPWSMQDKVIKNKDPELSFSAPHIAKNKGKIESVKRRQSATMDMGMRDDLSDTKSNYAYPSSTMSTAPSGGPNSPAGMMPMGYGYQSDHGLSPTPSVCPTATPSMCATATGPSQEEISRLSSLMETHQKNVNSQVDECRQFVMHSMDKIMNVLEQRLTDTNPPPVVHHPGAPHQPQAPHHQQAPHYPQAATPSA
jgi:hypothetical protein